MVWLQSERVSDLAFVPRNRTREIPVVNPQRRLVLHLPAAYGASLALVSRPASAILPLLAQVAIRVFIGTALRTAATRVIPAVGATVVRRYLLAVAVAYGIAASEADAIAAEAERVGATNLVKANDPRSRIEIQFQNPSESPIKLTGMVLELFDVTSSSVEDVLELHTVLVRPGKLLSLPYSFDFLRTGGPKELRVANASGRAKARSERFFAVL